MAVEDAEAHAEAEAEAEAVATWLKCALGTVKANMSNIVDVCPSSFVLRSRSLSGCSKIFYLLCFPALFALILNVCVCLLARLLLLMCAFVC